MTLKADLLVDCRCLLGEGPLWHPGRQELFWFDIDGCELFCATAAGQILSRWQFDQPVAAAGVVDNNTLLIAAADGLHRFDIASGARELYLPIEADNPRTRANDSRVNLAGGFWIGTMRRSGEGALGSLYQVRAGKIDTLLTGVDIPNSTCFSPDGRVAYFADTITRLIKKCAIDPETGLPVGEWEVFADTRDLPGAPDGSVVDSEGFLWNARYGGSSVIRFAPDGTVADRVDVGASKVTCPCFGGEDLRTLYITSASHNMTEAELTKAPHAGSLFAVEVDVAGQAETAVVL